MPNDSSSGSLKFQNNIAYNPNSNRRPLFLSNPFTMPSSDYKEFTKEWKPATPSPLQQYGAPRIQMPNSLINPNQVTTTDYSLSSVGPQPIQQKQSQFSMPNTLLKNPVTQGFSSPVQQPQGPRIYMPDYLGRRGSNSNWSDFLSIANLR